MSVDDENAQSAHAPIGAPRAASAQQFALGGDEKLDMRRLRQHGSDFVLDLAVVLGDALAKVHELEPRFDQVGFLEPAERRHVLEHAPREGAVAPALLAEVVDRAEKALPILGIDQILDLDQDRSAIVRDRPRPDEAVCSEGKA